MGFICLNLIDGSIVMGKEINKGNLNEIEIEDILLISTSTFGNGSQIFLTKYNIFGEDSIMGFNRSTIISKYKPNKVMIKYYKAFIEKLKDTTKDETIETPSPETKNPVNGPSFLNEYEEMMKISSEKFDIEDLRKNVHRLTDMDNEENDEDEDDDEDDLK